MSEIHNRPPKTPSENTSHVEDKSSIDHPNSPINTKIANVAKLLRSQTQNPTEGSSSLEKKVSENPPKDTPKGIFK